MGHELNAGADDIRFPDKDRMIVGGMRYATAGDIHHAVMRCLDDATTCALAAGNGQTSQKTLKTLAGHPDFFVRMIVALNVNTAICDRDVLENDKDRFVRAAAKMALFDHESQRSPLADLDRLLNLRNDLAELERLLDGHGGR